VLERGGLSLDAVTRAFPVCRANDSRPTPFVTGADAYQVSAAVVTGHKSKASVWFSLRNGPSVQKQDALTRLAPGSL